MFMGHVGRQNKERCLHGGYFLVGVVANSKTVDIINRCLRRWIRDDMLWEKKKKKKIEQGKGE